MTTFEALDWSPWRPEPLSSQAQRRRSGAPDATPAPDPAAELAQARAKAEREARAQGHAAGYEEGLEQGRAEGRLQGHAAGHAAGLAEGLEAGRAQAEEAAQRLAALIEACQAALHGVEADMGQALISLSLRIAEQVLHTTLEQRPEIVNALLAEIAQLNLGKSARLQLRLNPDDIELAGAYLQDDPEMRSWRLVPDSGITRGGCTAETPLGHIDATLETRWARVASALGRPS